MIVINLSKDISWKLAHGNSQRERLKAHVNVNILYLSKKLLVNNASVGHFV